MATAWEIVNGGTGIWIQVCLTQNLCSHPLCSAALLISKGSVRSIHLSEGLVCFPGETKPIASLFALSGTWAPYDGQHLPTSHFEAQVLDAQITRILVRCPRHLELSQLLKPGHLGVHIDLWGNIGRFLRELSGQRVSATSIHLYIGYTTGWGAHAQVLSSMSLAPLPRPCAENLKLLFPSLKLRHGKQVQQQNRKENTT